MILRQPLHKESLFVIDQPGMALPSEHITIKRRRDDEPVEALCKYPYR